MNTLNREQRKAVESDNTVVCVIAGAGTGKTKTLIQKVNSLIHEKKIPDHQILVLTFSRKAAEEIMERISHQSSNIECNITSGTFHSFSLRLLRTYCHDQMLQLGFTAFPGIISDDLKTEYIRSEIRKYKERFCGLPVSMIESMLFSEKRLSAHINRKLHNAGISKALSIIRENTTFRIREWLGFLSQRQSEDNSSEDNASETLKLQEGDQELSREQRDFESRYTNIRNALEAIEKFKETDPVSDLAQMEKLTEQSDLKEIDSGFEFLDKEFVDVMTYHEQKQERLRKALLS
ncbi:MAG TPA: UvrD-helicase domain-containing protein [Spirochaetota bacterium]|nr:UvrD-helicase domain-containing protein [Spirochaetota bacterium]